MGMFNNLAGGQFPTPSLPMPGRGGGGIDYLMKGGAPSVGLGGDRAPSLPVPVQPQPVPVQPVPVQPMPDMEMLMAQKRQLEEQLAQINAQIEALRNKGGGVTPDLLAQIEAQILASRNDGGGGGMFGGGGRP